MDGGVELGRLPVQDEDAAVLVRRAYKEYRSKVLFRKPNCNLVIRGMNMTVKKGTIYGLLGASGCGKTTILKSIVGQSQLTSGEVRVLGKEPGGPGSGVPGPGVGYMPQELSLYIGFTISETLRYFGWLTGIPPKELAARSAALLKFLDLPPAHCLIGQLSGGQQRRVSFAVALLHQPPLLILDEPTVGVDPVLRQRIWEHLMDITADGMTTVIITTHYIEEARQAHILGLMREGVLLEEDAPERMLARHGCSTMEEVFLKLSIRQARRGEAEAEDGAHQVQAEASPTLAAAPAPAPALAKSPPPAPAPPSAPALRSEVGAILRPANRVTVSERTSITAHMTCLLWKHLLWMRRNLPMVAFLTLLPAVQCMLFGFTVGRDPRNLRVAFANEEGPFACSRGSTDLVHTLDCDNPGLISCRHLRMLKNHTFDMEEFSSLDAAIGSVRAGKAWAIVHYPANFSRSLLSRIEEGQYADNETVVGSEISVWMDVSNSYIAQLMQAQMTTGTLQLVKDVLAHCGMNPNIADVPVKIQDPVYGSPRTEFLDFAAPGCALTLIFFMALASAVGAILSEKNEGLLDRTLVLGVTMREVMWSHIFIQTCMMVVQAIIVLVGFLEILRVTNDGPLFWVVLLCVMQGMSGMFLGMLVSSVCESDREATLVSLGSFFPFIVVSGMIWPVEGMHVALRYAGWGLPLTMATTSLRYMMGRGWGISQPQVLYGFLSTAVWILIFLSAVSFVLRTRKR